MKPNPGGMLQLNDIVGRDAVVAYLQTALSQQSILLVAERRTGKTHVLEKFKATAPADWVVIKRDIGAIRSAPEFVEYVMADLYPHLEAKTNFRNWLQSLGEQLGGTQIGPIKLPNFAAKQWKQILNDAVAHLHENKTLERVVFLWDELPWMLEIIAKNNPQEAMELLDVLRALRQQHASKLRMVFTGSLGLHHIVRRLKALGYNNTPVNDMLAVEVEPLTQTDAISLVQRLFTDNGLSVTSHAVYEETAKTLDCIPFYIHHVVSALLKQPASSTQPLDMAAVHAVIDHGIHSSDNPWDLQHYEERTLDYYQSQRAECLALLDVVASHVAPLSMVDAIRLAKAAYPLVEQQQWIELSRLLERDHYFIRNAASEVSFKFTVVKRWWVWHRGLTVQHKGEAA
ncbi:hypothetical protein CKO18_11565 [Rhodoferax fermentans]|uniref:ORC1/DEAH AAA+ ATPase domain-containing protein n=1 Tax=Rhodoferax fermentans TaxID=28066 RepID=A0A1T1ASW5_RHOFE|nr:hypothetical protein [Rhodoferax fermentans]OOV07065.1 hypothetical protein RF819_10305 [Rhodoferax fermentans]